MAAAESTKSKLQSNLSEFSALTRQLLEVVAGELKPAVTSGGGATEQQSQLLTAVLDKLIERDKEIQQSLDVAVEMRGRQKEIDQVDAELERRKQDVRELQLRLQDAERILELAVFHGRQKLESIKHAKDGAVSPEELIRYSHRVSQASSTVSPVGWQPSDPRRPYPQDIEMRSGMLGRLPSLGSKSGGGVTGPQEKKATLDANASRLKPGVNQNNGKKTAGNSSTGGTFNPFRPGVQSFPSMTFATPETMSEDSSPSSSDEGT